MGGLVPRVSLPCVTQWHGRDLHSLLAACHCREATTQTFLSLVSASVTSKGTIIPLAVAGPLSAGRSRAALTAVLSPSSIIADLLRMFFDCLYDEEVISEDAFYKWESSKDPAEQNGKGVALKSVTAFFTWLREAEEESEDN